MYKRQKIAWQKVQVNDGVRTINGLTGEDVERENFNKYGHQAERERGRESKRERKRAKRNLST